MTRAHLRLAVAAIATLATSPAFARSSQDRRRRHRLDDRRHRPGADDDGAGPRAVLRRHGAQEERARHHGAVARRHVPGLAALGLHRLFARFHRRRRVDRHARPRLSLRHDGGFDFALGEDDSRGAVHDLPDDLRHHHGGAGRRLGRRPSALLGLSHLLRALAHAGLCADRALGLGRRLSRQLWRDRFRRRHRGASQCRRRRLDRGLSDRRAPRLRPRKPGAARSHAGGDRHRPAVGRLVRLQRRLRARRQFARGDGDRRHPSRRQRRRHHLDGAGMVDARQAVGARHDLGRGGRASAPSRRRRAS